MIEVIFVRFWFNNKIELQIHVTVYPSIPRIHILKKILVFYIDVTIFQIFTQSSPLQTLIFRIFVKCFKKLFLDQILFYFQNGATDDILFGK